MPTGVEGNDPIVGSGSKRIELSDRSTIPPVGFGTYKTGGHECFNAVKHALDIGYRHIDTAMEYENEAAVGRAIEVSDVDRDDVFLTTKIEGHHRFVEHDRLLEVVEDCLEQLGTDYIDLLLPHWWNPTTDMESTFSAMDQLVEEGKVNNIGVSNFSLDQMREAMRVSDSPILTNQVEHHVYWQNNDILRFCQENDVTLTAYKPLAGGLLVDDEQLSAIGDRYGKSAAQVAIRWLLQQENVVTIPKAVTPEHARSNIDVFDFSLTEREMEVISGVEGPWWYRTNREGGRVYQLRNKMATTLPDSVSRRLARYIP